MPHPKSARRIEIWMLELIWNLELQRLEFRFPLARKLPGLFNRERLASAGTAGSALAGCTAQTTGLARATIRARLTFALAGTLSLALSHASTLPRALTLRLALALSLSLSLALSLSLSLPRALPLTGALAWRSRARLTLT